MSDQTIPPVLAAELAVGDRLATGVIPGAAHPGDVLFTRNFERPSNRWTFVAYEIVGGPRAGDVEGTHYLAEARIRLDRRADNGLRYSREADDPTPVSPARVPLHTGAMVGPVDGGALVDETPPPGVHHVPDGHVVNECCGKLDDAEHKTFCAQYRPRELVYLAPTADGGMVYALKRDRRTLTEVHAEALAEDNERAKAAVIAGLRAGEHGRVTNPNLARFLAEKENARRYQRHFFGLEESAKHWPGTQLVHFANVGRDTACGLDAWDGSGERRTADHSYVTCKACIDGLPF